MPIFVLTMGSTLNTYEREQSQQLFNAEMVDIIDELEEELSAIELAQRMYFAGRQTIINNPYMPSMMERDRPDDPMFLNDNNSATLITLGETFRKERWLVILGAPGSGKTTLARWIALKLASAMLNDESSVIVPAYQVDPKINKSDDTTIDIGPARLPVLLRVSEFSEAYQKARHNLETLSIADFLGIHSWLGQKPNLSPQGLNALIKHYLRLGRAVIILDGMDEITAANQRVDVVRSIETFIDNWINAHGNTVTMQEKSLLWSSMGQGEPAETGGNQIIVTSRIAGYQAATITGQVTHVTIQPMQQIAVEHFCDSWTLATHQLLNPNDDKETAMQQAMIEASGLKKAIFDPNRPRVRELASNPLLITILALVYKNNRGSLSEQRTELYHTAMEILIEEWRVSGLTTAELEYVLSPLAAHIHQHSSKGLIEESEMREIVTDELARFRQLDLFNLPPSFVLDVDDFLRRVREDVGLLSERSEQVYGFLHLTFQEYLAALHLVRDKRNAVTEIITKLDNPRWREPILMALGHISVSNNWGPRARQQLLFSLLEADVPLGEVVPRSALLIVSAIPEMNRVSKKVVTEIIHRLMRAYAEHDDASDFEILRERIQKGLTTLYKSKHRQVLEVYLAGTLSNIGTGNQNLGLAAADIIAREKWFSMDITKALVKAYPYDNADLEYPISNALNAIGIPEPSESPQKPKEPNQNLYEHRPSLQFNDDTLMFRQSLEREPHLVKFIKGNLSWLKLVTLLYGGITDEKLATYIVQYDEIASTLALEDNVRPSYIEQLRLRDYWRADWDTDDTVYTLAVYLDTICGKMREHAANITPEFKPEYIFSDSPLTPILLKALQAEEEPEELNKVLWEKWHHAKDDVIRSHALIILLLTDTDSAIKRLKTALVDMNMVDVAELIVCHLQNRFYTLKKVLVVLGSDNKIGETLNPLIDKIDTIQWSDLVECLYHIYSSVMHRPVKYDDVLIKQMSFLPYINAEIWAYWLSGYDEDAVYNFAVVLDTLGEKIASASALSHLHLAHGTKFKRFATWCIEDIPPSLSNPPDIFGDVLTVAQNSRNVLMSKIFHAGIIGYSGIKYSDYPGLLEEVLAVTLFLQPEEAKSVLEQLEIDFKRPQYERVDEIIERILAIQDCTIKSRALWRVAQYTYYWRNLNLWDASIEAAEQINDPLQRSRAFERLINYLPRKQSLRMRDEAEFAARKIEDPNNRARALARLAIYHTDKKRFSFLTETVETTEQIMDEHQRVEVVKLIRPYLGNIELLKMCDAIINNVNIDWVKRKGANLLSTKLLHYHSLLNEAQKLTPVILAVFIEDLINLIPSDGKRQNLWQKLLDNEERQAAIASLLKMAAQNDVQGLELTSDVCQVLQVLLLKNEISSVYVLIPYLQNSDRTLLTQLQTWLEANPDKELWRYSGLMLAEAGLLDAKTIPCIFELLEHGVDIGRYRASLVLHGEIVCAGRLDRQYRTSRLGLETILLLGNKLAEVIFQERKMESVLSYCWYNIFHDDYELFSSLIKIAEGPSENARGAQLILRRIDHLYLDTNQVLIRYIEKATNIEVIKNLLKSWISMFHEHKPDHVTEPTTEIKRLIHNLPQDVLDEFRTIPNRALTVASIVLAVSENASNNLENAIPILEEKLLDASLGLTTHTLQDISEHMFYRWKRDPEQAKEAAQQIVLSQIGIELLFTWLNYNLKTDLTRDLSRDTSYYYKLDTLLLVASECAKLAPASVFNLTSKYNMADNLAHATMRRGWFFARAAAMSLLCYVRHPSHNFVTAVLHGLHDVPEVQQATLNMVRELRYLDVNIVPKIIEMLQHHDASTTYAAIQILTIIGRSEKTDGTIRKQILHSLSSIIKNKHAMRGIFVFEATEANQYIRSVGRIDQVAYKAIMDISGII